MSNKIYINLSDNFDKIKKMTMEYEEAEKIVGSIGEYYGYGYCWDFKLDLDLKFNLGYYYRPNLSDESLFDSKCSSDALDNEIKRLILKNIENTAKEALLNIEKRLKNEQLITDKLIKEYSLKDKNE